VVLPKTQQKVLKSERHTSNLPGVSPFSVVVVNADLTSRELVGQAAYEAFHSPETEGATLDVIDGSEEIGKALKEAVEQGRDSWTG
jgi:hypothetical protein